MKKRVGIIVDSTSVTKQIYDLIALSKESNNYEITTLLVNSGESDNKLSPAYVWRYIRRLGFMRFFSSMLFRFVCILEEIIVAKNKKFAKVYDNFDLSYENIEIIKMSPAISKSGLVYRYNAHDLALIKSAKLNCLIRGGSGILKGEILNVCSNGVISFHHADNSVNRGGPPGFWEVYEKNPRTGFVIQRLKEELDGGDILYRGYVVTHWLYSLNQANLYEVSNPFFHDVLDVLTSDEVNVNVEDKTPYCYPLFKSPRVIDIVKYITQTSILLVKKIFRRLMGKAFRWGVAYQYSESWKHITLWRSVKIPNPKNRFLADPFLFTKDGRNYCFVEDYDNSLKKGSISAYEIQPSGFKDLGMVLEEDFHLSFPFIFEYKNEIYMCPETAEKNEIRLYKCLDFPCEWSFHVTLMRNVDAVDTMIFEREDGWWLFTNMDKSPVGDHNSQLYIFYSKDPLSEDWIPHAANPVVFDPLRARNGGLIQDGEEVYRVFQRQGFDMYGEASGIAKIATLTLSEFEEDHYAEIPPHFFRDIHGTHTYNFSGGVVVLDYIEISNYGS